MLSSSALGAGGSGSRDAHSLEGKVLIAMPGIGDPRFERTVIYMCVHSSEGAMGLVLNKLASHIAFPDLLDQLEIKSEGATTDMRVHVGGPVEMDRGFVLHSQDYDQANTIKVGDSASLTATVDILRAIAKGEGPRDCLFALGYASWAGGQLDTEIQMNGWLHADADRDILFSPDLETTWTRAISKIGFDIGQLSHVSGHA